jgi:hypothetical protein
MSAVVPQVSADDAKTQALERSLKKLEASLQRIWKDFFVGVDARYHLTSGRNDGIKIDGVTAGGYLGIGF